MTVIKLTKTEARELAVIAQRLDRRPRGKITKARVLETIEHLGCVQLDTISVVARSHETVLWSRLGEFDPALVWKLYGDRKLFEYWTHAAAITPIWMFPYFRWKMDEYNSGEIGEWIASNAELAELVLREVTANGPLMSRAFETPEDRDRSPWAWWGGKPTKQMLDLLWTRGDLTIVNRAGFQRLYDLTDRAIAEELRVTIPTEAEIVRFFTAKSLSAMGIATAKWCADYFRAGAKPHVNFRVAAQELDRMVEEGLAHRAEIEGYDQPVWLDAAMLPKLDEIRAGRGRPVLTTLLSPFDNLVWHRERVSALFGFDYLLEIYIPEPKRIFGYYTLPILHRGRMIGRLDLHYARKAKVMTVRAAHLEPKVRPSDRIAEAILGAVEDYTRFLGGGEIVLGTRQAPADLGPLLAAAIRNRRESREESELDPEISEAETAGFAAG